MKNMPERYCLKKHADPYIKTRIGSPAPKLDDGEQFLVKGMHCDIPCGATCDFKAVVIDHVITDAWAENFQGPCFEDLTRQNNS